MNRLEQAVGGLLILFVLADVFLTVLYARVGTGLLSGRLARTQWRLFKPFARLFGTNRGKALSFCAPTILVSLVAAWALILSLGAGLLVQPALGTAVRASVGGTPHDFSTALYAGASSLSFVGGGDFAPYSPRYRLLFIFDSLVGVSVMSLTLTYLMQVYTALRQRNTFGLKLHLMTGETADAVELLVGLGMQGRFDTSYSVLAEIAGEAAMVKEAHHFYPVLAFFRFRDTFYSMSAPLTIGLDSVSLIKSALDDEEYGWLKESSAVMLLWRSMLMSTTLLDRAYAHAGKAGHGEPPDAEARERFRRRFIAACARLRQAGVKTRVDEEKGVEIYTTLRADWDHRIRVLAHSMEYAMNEIDPGGVHPLTTEALPAFRNRLSTAG